MKNGDTDIARQIGRKKVKVAFLEEQTHTNTHTLERQRWRAMMMKIIH